MLRKLLAVVTAAAALTVGAATAAGAAPVACGWYMGDSPLVVHQCVYDGNHFIINDHRNIGGGQMQVTTTYNAWHPSWLNMYINEGNFAGSPATLHFCQNTSGSSGTPMFTHIIGGPYGWDHAFRRVWAPGNGSTAQQDEGAMSHFHGFAYTQSFGGETPNQNVCPLGLGVRLSPG